jgi:ATP-dependent RNA helicase DOB1
VATELLFNGTLIKMDKHELVALVSCLVPAEKSDESIKLTTKMAEPLAQLQETLDLLPRSPKSASSRL